MTRVAFLNADMWTELFLDNRGPLQQEIEGIIGQLRAFSEALRAGDAAQLHALLQDCLLYTSSELWKSTKKVSAETFLAAASCNPEAQVLCFSKMARVLWHGRFYQKNG